MSNAQPCAEKVFINLNAPAEFQLIRRILGEDNANLQFIVQETKAKVTLRGKDSRNEQNGNDMNEPLHMYIEHPALKSLIEAKNLAKNLIETIQSELHLFLNKELTLPQQQQQGVIQQQPPPVIQTNNQQFSIPHQLSCPPPTIIHQMPQQNYIAQHQIIPQNVPMQIIHQTPPPNQMRTTPIVQFQGQTLHQIQSGGQQILLNQSPTQQYQLQYIPSSNQITNAQGMQIQQPIQHFIQQQPQQQIQGILQPANGQQFITVQGNASYMNQPPPNIIQQTPQQNINAVFSSQPTVTISQEDLQSDANKLKQDSSNEQLKNQQNLQHLTTRIVNQPPPYAVIPPQAYQQHIQQFIVNGNQVWPQQQQIPMNSQIQIVAQPQTIRSGNELVLQQNSSGQQVLTTFNQQQGGQQQFQQIQFHQATITQPPPQQQQQQQQHSQMHIIQSNQQNISYQQQFEQKINQTNEVQQRAVKRKFDGEVETVATKALPKIGVGQSSAEASTQSKTRMLAMNSQSPQQPWKMTLNGPGVASTGATGDPRVNQNQPGLTRNLASTSGNQVLSTVEPKKNENESNVANDSSQFMIRTGNQSYRFQAPQNFIHQLPPPIAQNTQSGQIMSNSNMRMLEKLIQQPPPPPTVNPVAHQYIQEMIQQDLNVYHQNNNYHVNGQPGNSTRMTSPQQQQQIPMSEGNNGGVQQQQRFRQQQQQW